MQPPPSMEGEVNHMMPGNTMVPGIGGAPNGFQGMQPPNFNQQPPAGGMPPQNFNQQPPAGGMPAQNFNQQPPAGMNFQPQPIGAPPVNNPPPQAVPQAAPLELEE